MKFKKFIAAVISVAMIISCVNFTAFAEETSTEVTTAAAVKVNEDGYETLANALEKAKAMTGDVTVEINDKVTLNQNLNGSYSSIKFVGKTDSAEIYIDLQGYVEASGKNVAFENLTLSKSDAEYIYNAGFMNVAFGVYQATTVNYTNCTFANGAYASKGINTFTKCTFKRSHDKYSLWAYGDVEVIVDNCTFDDYRGIKMYAEGAAKTVDLTVKNTDFSAVTGKPAIVLTYGESVTLEGNTYSTTGVFELDLDGAPNGTPVTSDVAPTCKNDNGACGVLVDGKIYTTVAQAAEVATKGSTVTLLHNSTETVKFAEGVTLDKNGFAAENVTATQTGLSGSGTEKDPYLINNLDELKWFRDSVNDTKIDGSNQYTGKYIKLTSDIDLEWEEWTPIGVYDSSKDHINFQGIFDGAGHKIYNLKINSTNRAGFFGELGLSTDFGGVTTIKNITFENVDVVSTAGYVGAVASNPFCVTFDNVHVTGNINVEGGSYTAVIAGHGYGNFNNCSVDGGENKGTVESTGWAVGGIAGHIGDFDSDFTNCTVKNLVIKSSICGAAAIAGYGADFKNSSKLYAENVDIIAESTYYPGGNGLLFGLYGAGDNFAAIANSSVKNCSLTEGGEKIELYYDMVAEVGGVYYTELQAAVTAAKSGDTITVIADIADETVTVDKNLTITGNVTANNVSINANGCDELTVSNLSFTGNSWINSGTAEKLTVSGVTANVTPVNGNGTANNMTNSRSAFISLGKSEQQSLELTVENCNIVSNGGTDPILGWAAITKATITGNTFGSASAYQTNSDSVKFMGIAEGAEFTLTNNTVYSNYNGFVFGQNTTRDNAYTAVIEKNTFIGSADHVWIEVSGATTTNATILATSDNTVNGEPFTASDIKVHPNIKTWTSYAGVDVKTDANGKVTGGTFLTNPETAIADGYAALADLDGNYVVGTKPTATVNNLGLMTIPAGEWKDMSFNAGTTDMPLSFVMQFLADQDAEDMETSPYADWYGDFVITVTGLENGSFSTKDCYLAGHYGSFGWIKVPLEGILEEVEEAVRYPVMLGVGMGQKYDYICSGVEDFKCAMYLTPEVLEKNPNIKVNLELCLVDNSKGSDAAATAIVNNENCYTVEDHTYVAEDFVLNYVAEANGTKYLTLEDALAQGGNVKLIDNVELEAPITVDNTVTLDLNGKTISGISSESASYALITNKGDLTIKDSSAEQSGKITYKYTGASSNWSFAWGNYTIANRGTLTVDGGTIENTTNLTGHMYDAIDNYSGATATINGGTVSCPNYIAIRLFATSKTDDNSVTINGGTINGKFTIWPQNASSNSETPYKATLALNGGTITATEGGTALYISEFSDAFTITKADSVTLAEPEGYKWVNGKLTEDLLDTDTSFIRNISTTNTNGDARYQVILFCGIDSLHYKEVGFEITVAGDTRTQGTDTVYRQYTAAETTFYPDAWGDNCLYICGLKINFPTELKDESVTFRPYVENYDGTKVYGKYKTIDKIYNKVIKEAN